MTAKNTLWLSRIEHCVRMAHQTIIGNVMASQDDPELNDDVESLAVAEALDKAVIGEAPLTMSLRKAFKACEELHGPCRASNDLDPVQQIALEYLALVTGVSAVMHHRATLRASFASSTLTYQGDFERFKDSLRMGVSNNHSPEERFSYVDAPEVTNVKVLERSYDRLDGEGSSLKTCRVTATLEFELSVLTEQGTVDFLALAKSCRAAVTNSDRTIPMQRLNLQNVELLSTSID
jgi:hypothetical protein